VRIGITTTHCEGKPVYVTLLEGTSSFRALDILKEKSFIVPSENSFSILLQSGEDDDVANICLTSDPECRYYVIASADKLPDGTLSSFVFMNATLINQFFTAHTNYYFSKDKDYGNLAYNCDSICDENWTYISDTSDNASSNSVNAQDGGSVGDPNSACAGQGEDCYELYSGFAEVLNSRLDTLENKFDVVHADSLGGLVNGFIAIAIGVAGVLAVVMIMYQGFLYLKTDNPVTLDTAKSRILKTSIGFLLLLFMYALLRTINPDLLNLIPRIDTVKFDPGGDTEIAVTPTNGQSQANLIQNASTYGITCPGSGGVGAIPSIAQSFVGKVTYQMGAKGFVDGANMLYFDCSGFVKAVYACAGLPALPDGTGGLFSGATQNSSGGVGNILINGVNLGPTPGSVGIVSLQTSVSANGQPLKIGDLLGWTAGSLTEGEPEGHGHVVLYIGNGKTIESRSTGKNQVPGKALVLRDTTAYKKRIKFIRYAP
jgi:cell wall-associated NlpC family hydrolase